MMQTFDVLWAQNEAFRIILFQVRESENRRTFLRLLLTLARFLLAAKKFYYSWNHESIRNCSDSYQLYMFAHVLFVRINDQHTQHIYPLPAKVKTKRKLCFVRIEWAPAVNFPWVVFYCVFLCRLWICLRGRFLRCFTCLRWTIRRPTNCEMTTTISNKKSFSRWRKKRVRLRPLQSNKNKELSIGII